LKEKKKQPNIKKLASLDVQNKCILSKWLYKLHKEDEYDMNYYEINTYNLNTFPTTKLRIITFG